MRLLQSPNDPVLSPSICVRPAESYPIVDHRFDGVEECPNLLLKVGQTVGEAVDLSDCTCRWCEIVRSDPTPYFNECLRHLAVVSEHPEANTDGEHHIGGTSASPRAMNGLT